MAILIILKRLAQGLATAVTEILVHLGVFLWDILLTLYNHITPKRSVGHVVQAGNPGFSGKWPEYNPPKDGDSRCSCPALNALANHGILPRDGRNITFKELGKVVRDIYNFAPTFGYLGPKHAADFLDRNYWTDSFDLADLDAHNCIEHDASVTRADSYHQADQGQIPRKLVEEVLSSGTGPNGQLTKPDLSRLMGKRRIEAKRANPKYSLSLFHKLFGSWNCSTLLVLFGGNIDDLRVVLGEERLPDGWEPRFRRRMGLTILEFNFTVLPVELSVKEEVDGSLAAVGKERYGGNAETKKVA
ncbi:chloroperoxidase-like protein [Pilatotrama ljubarskyi]|nr:chloroperoxidase-like protein [Pilatotrama ljubarskyi]